MQFKERAGGRAGEPAAPPNATHGSALVALLELHLCLLLCRGLLGSGGRLLGSLAGLLLSGGSGLLGGLLLGCADGD